MAVTLRLIFIYVLSTCIVLPVFGEKNYPNATFYDEYYDKCPIIYFKFESPDQVGYFNKIQDSLESLKEENHLEYLYHYAVIELANMNKVMVDSTLKSIKRVDNIRTIKFKNCTIQELPDTLNSFQTLDAIYIMECDSLKSIGKFDPLTPIFEFYFFGCHIPSLPHGMENIRPMVRLLVHFPDTLGHFDLNTELDKFSKRNNLIDLAIRGKEIAEFPESIFSLTSLRSLRFETEKGINYPYKFDKLINLLELTLTCWDEEVENSARKNPNFIYYRPVEYEEFTSWIMLNYEYKNLSFILKGKETYTYNDSKGIFYSKRENKETIKNEIYYIGKNRILIHVDYDGKKIIFKLLDENKKDFKVSLLNLRQKVISQGISIDNELALNMSNIVSGAHFLKITLGRYSKQFNFYM